MTVKEGRYYLYTTMVSKQEGGKPRQLQLTVPWESLQVQRPGRQQPKCNPGGCDDGSAQQAWTGVEESGVRESGAQEEVDVFCKVGGCLALVYNRPTVVQVCRKDRVGQEKRCGVVSRRQSQVPVEVSQHDKLQVDEISEWEIILDKQVELAATRHRSISEMEVTSCKPVAEGEQTIFSPFLHLACQQQCSQTHQV